MMNAIVPVSGTPGLTAAVSDHHRLGGRHRLGGHRRGLVRSRRGGRRTGGRWRGDIRDDRARRRRDGDGRIGRHGRHGTGERHRRRRLVEFVAGFGRDADPADLADFTALHEREVDRGVGRGRQRHRDAERSLDIVGQRAPGECDDRVAVDGVDRPVPAVDVLGDRVGDAVRQPHVELRGRRSLAAMLDGETDGESRARPVPASDLDRCAPTRAQRRAAWPTTRPNRSPWKKRVDGSWPAKVTAGGAVRQVSSFRTLRMMRSPVQTDETAVDRDDRRAPSTTRCPTSRSNACCVWC